MKSVPTRQTIENALPAAILLVIAYMGYATLRPFLPAILWALTLGVSLAPLHMRLTRRLGKRRGLATAMVTVLMVLFLLLPMIGLSRAMIAFVPEFLMWADGIQLPLEGEPDLVLDTDDLLSWDLARVWSTLKTDIAVMEAYFGTELRPFAVWAVGEGRVLGSFVMEFALGIILAALMIHRQDQIRPFLHQFFLNLGGALAARMAKHASVTIRSTFIAVLLAAAAQSAVASVAYVVSGVPHWAILSALTFLLAMFQVGPILIWAPIALWLAQDGQTGLAVFVSLWGLVAVGLTDNLVRVVFVSKASDLPGILAFLGAIGGLLAWGVVGVFLGPVILAVCHRLIVEWTNEETKEQSKTVSKPPA